MSWVLVSGELEGLVGRTVRWPTYDGAGSWEGWVVEVRRLEIHGGGHVRAVYVDTEHGLFVFREAAARRLQVQQPEEH